MKNQLGMNPYLPGTEYVPDGEPHIFGDRLYVYGSHDRFNGSGYCQEPYVCWSAPTDDLTDWRYEGVILEKGQDPLDPDGDKNYYAPDAVQGPDGRYYLYYSIEESSVISVAVCDTPAGAYHFLGHVSDKEGRMLGMRENDPSQFDPAVLADDDGKVYLYSGNCLPVPGLDPGNRKGSFVCELEPDMVTMKTEQKLLTSGGENCFAENPFFEASSIRKFNGKYYFIYSPLPNVHNLCYAVSDYPDRDFRYQGVLVSNADIFDGQEETYALTYWGNNHGSLVEVNGEYYVFYHRHTNKSGWNRQGCAEKIRMNPDGTFRQAELTSGGLRGVLPAKATYSCNAACHLRKKNMTPYAPFQFTAFDENDPYLTQEEGTVSQYIANFRDGSRADYRYFSFDGTENTVRFTCRGDGKGELVLCDLKENREFARIEVTPTEKWSEFSGEITGMTRDKITGGTPNEAPGAGGQLKGIVSLGVTYRGTGAVDLLDFTFETV